MTRLFHNLGWHMRILRLFSVLWFCGFSAISQSQSTDGLWIDVRSEEEVAEHAVSGTYHIPHTDIANRIAEVTSDKDATIHLFCRSGGRAKIARKALLDMGYTNVINEGGYVEAEKKLEQETPPT